MLAPGDDILDYDGNTPLTVISNVFEETTERVCNFEISGTHNYFAGDVGAWVHNAGRNKARDGFIAGIIRLGAGFGDPNPGNPEDFFEPEPGIEINTSCPLPPFPFEGPPPKPKKLSKFAKSLRNSVSRLPFWGDRLTKIQKEHGSV